jgi:hypothetical protein
VNHSHLIAVQPKSTTLSATPLVPVNHSALCTHQPPSHPPLPLSTTCAAPVKQLVSHSLSPSQPLCTVCPVNHPASHPPQTLSTTLCNVQLQSTPCHVVVKKNVSYLCTYDLYGPIRNAFDGGRYITRTSGSGLGPGN